MKSILLVIHIWMLCQHYKMKTIHRQRYRPLYIFHATRNVSKRGRSNWRAVSFFSPRLLVFKVITSYLSGFRSMWSHLCHLEFLQEISTYLRFTVKTQNRSSNSSLSRSTLFIPKFCHSGCAASAPLSSPIRRTSGVSSLAAHSAAFLQSWITLG